MKLVWQQGKPALSVKLLEVGILVYYRPVSTEAGHDTV